MSTAPCAAFFVSLLTDYGLEDGFVGALHSVIGAQAPGARVIDLTHGIPPQDVRAGSFALLRLAPYLAPGAVVAIVDPGVGTARRCIAVRRGGPDGRARPLTFVGPDNGLMLPAIEALGGPEVAVELEDRGYWIPAPGPTFAGRDIFGPAAAQLAMGHDILDLGRAIEASSLVALPPPVVRAAGAGAGEVEVEVTWVDRFGNVQLAAHLADLPWWHGDEHGVVVRLPSRRGAAEARAVARVVSTFGDLSQGELGVLVDSYGYLELVLASGNAAARLSVREGDRLEVSPLQPG
ncbi:MAG TPA: SAM-dependent chlorinase/fluorinase [Acidimicrobiales bacterium]|nr:SAM-dependent chlorinase/fluorinase [Acidimicrobiales bacterium]